MKTLTLEHLSFYLPYELNFYGASDIWTLHSLGIEDICIFNGLRTQTLSFDDCMSDYSPILHPLSNYKDINSPASMELDTLSLLELNQLAKGKIELDNIYYATLKVCAQHHIDIFNLIPDGLAVDKNTVNP